MDIRKVKKLIELLDESGIAEIEITEGEESIRISRYAVGAPAAPLAYSVPSPLAAAAPAATAAEAPVPAAAAEPEEDGYEVAAPMVGTFYASASPGASPYVQVGDRVNEGDTYSEKGRPDKAPRPDPALGRIRQSPRCVCDRRHPVL